MGTDAPVLLLGEGDLADEVRSALDALEVDVVRLPKPTTRELEEAFGRGPVAKAVVVARDDAVALRMALMVRDADRDTLFEIGVVRDVTASRPG